MGGILHPPIVHPLPGGGIAYSGSAPTTSSAATAAALAQQDPGRMVVHAAKAPEPVFVAPTSTVNVKRVLHSEVYLRLVS